MGLSSQRADRLLTARQTDRQAFIETFNETLRDECLSLQWFDNLA
jgi:hypothetical protein